MKTNITIASEDRILYGIKVRQNSKDQFICITDAFKALELKRKEQGLSNKELSDILSTQSFQEKLKALMKELYGESDFSPTHQKALNINDLRKNKLAYKRGKDKDQHWFINPYVFTMVALEMDPEFYAKVTIWLTDGLISLRNDAGDMYRKMTQALSRFKDVDYEHVGVAINCIVFGKHEPNIRNSASTGQLKEVYDLQVKLLFIIEEEMVQSCSELIQLMRKMYFRKYRN